MPLFHLSLEVQFELSVSPLASIHQICREAHAHLMLIHEVAKPIGISFLGIGANPMWMLHEIPTMPKSRYKIMTDYMPKVGQHGLDMMYRTSPIQVNLDFSSETDMRRKMQIFMKLQPVEQRFLFFFTLLLTEGKPMICFRNSGDAQPHFYPCVENAFS